MLGASGAAYLFSFPIACSLPPTFAIYHRIQLYRRKNYNLSQLDSSDVFGSGISDGNRLVVSARYDDGFGNVTTNSGAAYLFSLPIVYLPPHVTSNNGIWLYTGGKKY